jgi:HSP20 family protein
MAIIRWQPAREVSSFQGLFGTFFDTPAGGQLSARRWVPAVDLVEEGDRYVLRADLPGLSENDVKVELEDRVLTVSGERRTESEQRSDGYHRVERASGRFSRALRLPAGVDDDAIEARFENGVLEVSIPKPAQSKPRRVEIKAVRSQPAEVEAPQPVADAPQEQHEPQAA